MFSLNIKALSRSLPVVWFGVFFVWVSLGVGIFMLSRSRDTGWMLGKPDVQQGRGTGLGIMTRDLKDRLVSIDAPEGWVSASGDVIHLASFSGWFDAQGEQPLQFKGIKGVYRNTEKLSEVQAADVQVWGYAQGVGVEEKKIVWRAWAKSAWCDLSQEKCTAQEFNMHSQEWGQGQAVYALVAPGYWYFQGPVHFKVLPKAWSSNS